MDPSMTEASGTTADASVGIVKMIDTNGNVTTQSPTSAVPTSSGVTTAGPTSAPTTQNSASTSTQAPITT